MQRLIIAAMIFLGVSCREKDHEPVLAASASSVLAADEAHPVCRFEITKPPEAMRLFAVTTQGGGRTCYSTDRVILIVPKPASGCLQLGQHEYDNVRVVPRLEAEGEYVRCSALSLDVEAPKNPALIFTRSNNEDEEINDAFIDFSLDLGALISNDGLPATYYLPGGPEICIEGPNLEELRRHIRASQIVDPAHIHESVRPEGCGRSAHR